ncbi:MAG: hypothetical protein ACPGID_03270 [Rubricella sp.]
MAWDLSERIERARPSDPHRDYCLWDYEPPQSRLPGALRTSALLYQSFAWAGVSERMIALTDAIRGCLGPFNTVFGVKWAGGRMSWEFYVYDYARQERRVSLKTFSEALKPHLRLPACLPDQQPYFMFSIEVDEAVLAAGKLDLIDIYIGIPGATVSAGMCYGVTDEAVELRNLYHFYDAARDGEAILHNLYSSIHVPPDVPPERFLWPEMQGVQTIVVGTKRFNDGLYFSRISVEQLLFGLRRLEFPAPIVTYLEENRDRFAHYLFDLGYDYLVEGDAVKPIKGSFYGLL